jgi:hypothetical protein
MTSFAILTTCVLLGVWVIETLLFVLSYKLSARVKETR